MLFSSLPPSLDPHNWQQQSGSGGESNQLSPPGRPPSAGGGGGAATNRAGSMAERARLGKLQQPETALKCPRCESANTKFCYFNNYSLSQPRHFCKTCRRYWTRGGALRNVPVGGGCRRNKRIKKSSRSKTPLTIDHQRQAAGYTTAPSSTSNMAWHFLCPPPQLNFLPSLPRLSDYGSPNFGLSFAGITQPPVGVTSGAIGGINMEYQSGDGISGGDLILTGRFDRQWRLHHLQQFPFLGGSDPAAGLYPFEVEGVDQSGLFTEAATDQIGSKPLDSGAIDQLATVKIEENRGLNLSGNFMDISGNDQCWGGNLACTDDLSGFAPSSTGQLF